MSFCMKTFAIGGGGHELCSSSSSSSASFSSTRNSMRIPAELLLFPSSPCKRHAWSGCLHVRDVSSDLAHVSFAPTHITKVDASSPPSTGSKLLLEGTHAQESANGAAFSRTKKNHGMQGGLDAALSAMDVALRGQHQQVRPRKQQSPHREEKEQDENGDVSFALDGLSKGRLVENRFMYRQTFVIRSYEVRFDKTASIETITNLFQETALNHVGMMDFVGDGMGTTHAMTESRLIWIVTRLHIEVNTYPVWGDVVEIDSWVSASGKNGMKRDFWVRDFRTGRILARGTSNWAMMNQDTRRLSKMPDAVRAEISPFFLDRSVMQDIDCSGRIPALDNSAPFIKGGLVPKLQDLDMNQHVNHVKYIDWVLECVPQSILMSSELKSIVLEYRRECGPTDMVESLLHMESTESSNGSMETTAIHQCTHLLRLQNCRTEVLRARTLWRPKGCC